MKKFWKVFGKIAGILTAVIGVLFVVYFWNLDQKLLSWAYTQVNRIFDRKKADVSRSFHLLREWHPQSVRCPLQAGVEWNHR